MTIENSILIFLLILINFSCSENNNKKTKVVKQELINIETKETINTKEKIKEEKDSLSIINTVSSDTIKQKVNNTQKKEENKSNFCSINGKIKFTHALLGAPYIEGGDNGPSFTELVKRATSENYSYKIEVYLKGKLQNEIITNYKNNFRYKFKVKKNALYKIKFYFSDSDENEFKEITSGNFWTSYLKVKDEDKKKWDIHRVFFTV